jgi:hypothetical protein
MAPGDRCEAGWHRAARSLAWRWNLAAWLDRATPVLVALGLAGAAALLIGRRLGVAAPRTFSALAVAALLTLAWAAWRCRRDRFTLADALCRLDMQLALHNRLTCAAQGIGPWPPLPQRLDDRLRFRPWRVAPPLAFAAVLLAVAWLLPVAARSEAPPAPTEAPLAWSQVEAHLQGLEEQGLADQGALERWRERLAQLEKQPQADWYGHGSLEAGDALQRQLEESMRDLARGLDRASDALDEVEQAGDDASRQQAGARLGAAARSLESGGLSLDRRLLDRMKDVDPQRLTPEQLEGLRQRAREGAGFCRLRLRECQPGDTDCVGGRRGPATGRGGVDRGPGHPPLALGERNDLHTTRSETASSPDLDRAAPGEVVGITRGTHRVDPARPAVVEGGVISGPGHGGEAVWRTPLSPEERRVLERYFK